MKKILLTQISSVEILSKEEMKVLQGGMTSSSETSGKWKSCPDSKHESPAYVACCNSDGTFKKPGEACSYFVAGKGYVDGKCQAWIANPVHCGHLNTRVARP